MKVSAVRDQDRRFYKLEYLIPPFTHCPYIVYNYWLQKTHFLRPIGGRRVRTIARLPRLPALAFDPLRVVHRNWFASHSFNRRHRGRLVSCKQFDKPCNVVRTMLREVVVPGGRERKGKERKGKEQHEYVHVSTARTVPLGTLGYEHMRPTNKKIRTRRHRL